MATTSPSQPTIEPILVHEYQFMCNNLLTEDDIKLCENILDTDLDSGVWPESDRSSISSLAGRRTNSGGSISDEDSAQSSVPEFSSTSIVTTPGEPSGNISDELSISSSSRSSNSSSPPIRSNDSSPTFQSPPPRYPSISSNHSIPSQINLDLEASGGCPLTIINPPSYFTSTRVPQRNPQPILPRNTGSGSSSSGGPDSKSLIVPVGTTRENKSPLSRKERNREAASLSRQRQKDYVQNLEAEVKKLKDENSHLRAQVDSLRIRLSQYETDKPFDFLPSSYLPNKKRAFGLLVVVFVFAVNFGPISILGPTNQLNNNEGIHIPIPQQQKPHIATGRHLLWTEQGNFTVFNSSSSLINDSIETGQFTSSVRNESSQAPGGCGAYLNETESRRLQSELRGWALQLEEDQRKVKDRLNSERILRKTSTRLHHRTKSMAKIKRLKSPWARLGLDFDYWLGNEQQDRGEDEQWAPLLSDSKVSPHMKGVSYKDLVSAIDRRKDTFYFVSFDIGDNLLLLPQPPPPMAGNSTSPSMNDNVTSSDSFPTAGDFRPRFSVVMPTLVPSQGPKRNSTSSRGLGSETAAAAARSYTLVQIDCEVIGIKHVTLPST